MLLHELQHYRHKDAWIGFFMNLAKTIYWFHPLVWYALKEMRDDRKLPALTPPFSGCLTKVPIRLRKHAPAFCRNSFHAPSPFAAELGGSKKTDHAKDPQHCVL